MKNTNTIITCAFAAFLFIGMHVNAQNGVAVNTTNAPVDPSAILDASSTTQGVLVPRMTTLQRNAIVNPAEGLLIYQTDGTEGFYYFDGAVWKAVSSGGGGGSVGYTMMSYPVLTTSYTSSATNFAYDQYYGNFALSSSIYNELLTNSGGTTVQMKLVAIGYIAGGVGSTTCNVQLKEYFSGSVFGTWSGTYVNGTDNINIETPWTTISSVPGHRGYRFEMSNTGGRNFTLYNVCIYLRVQ